MSEGDKAGVAAFLVLVGVMGILVYFAMQRSYDPPPSPAVVAARRMEACKKEERDTTFDGVIKDISFYIAYSERVGKRTQTVPDKWWLNICDLDAGKKCYVIKITHAPWEWQAVGNKVRLTWQHRCSTFGLVINGPEMEPAI